MDATSLDKFEVLELEALTFPPKIIRSAAIHTEILPYDSSIDAEYSD
jgi:hypothetical protein